MLQNLFANVVWDACWCSTLVINPISFGVEIIQVTRSQLFVNEKWETTPNVWSTL